MVIFAMSDEVSEEDKGHHISSFDQRKKEKKHKKAKRKDLSP